MAAYSPEIVPQYRSMTEFRNFSSVKGATTTLLGINMNAVYTAEENTPSRSPDPHFERNSYHIALREGEFDAQKDKAGACLYRHFLGYGPEVDIIKDGEEFYVASRTIKDLQHVSCGLRHLLEETSKPSVPSPEIIKNLGGIVALCYFFGEGDVHSLNWGFQWQQDECLGYKIDNAGSFDQECLERHLDLQEIDEQRNFTFLLPDSTVKSQVFQSEKLKMLEKIAASDFLVIRNLLKTIITKTELANFENFKRRFCFLLEKPKDDLGTLENQDIVRSIIDALRKPEKELPKTFGVEEILSLLEARHRALPGLLAQQKSSFMPLYSAHTALSAKPPKIQEEASKEAAVSPAESSDEVTPPKGFVYVYHV